MDGPTRGGKRRAGAKIHFKHLCEMADLRRELDQVGADYAERRSARPLRANVRASRPNRATHSGISSMEQRALPQVFSEALSTRPLPI